MWNLDSIIFPEIHHSCEIAGKTTLQCSLDTGLPAGIKVIYGGGDIPMQLVGNGGIVMKWLKNNILSGFSSFSEMNEAAANIIRGAMESVIFSFDL